MAEIKNSNQLLIARCTSCYGPLRYIEFQQSIVPSCLSCKKDESLCNCVKWNLEEVKLISELQLHMQNVHGIAEDWIHICKDVPSKCTETKGEFCCEIEHRNPSHFKGYPTCPIFGKNYVGVTQPKIEDCVACVGFLVKIAKFKKPPPS